MDTHAEFIYASLFNNLDSDSTLSGRCTVMDLLNRNAELNDLSLAQCKEVMYNFYSKYNDKYPEIVYCLNVTLESREKITYKQLKIQGDLNSEDVLKHVGENETLKDVFIYSIERQNFSRNFVKYKKVFNYTHSEFKDTDASSKGAENGTPAVSSKENSTPVDTGSDSRSSEKGTPVGRASTFPSTVKKETPDSLDVPQRSKTELKSASSGPVEKKQWTAPKAKQRGLDSMFKRKPKSETPVKKEPAVAAVEKSKEKRLESKFQFTTRKLIDKRKEEEKAKEEERVKIVQERLNGLKSGTGNVAKREPVKEETLLDSFAAKSEEPLVKVEEPLVKSEEQPLKKMKVEQSLKKMKIEEPPLKKMKVEQPEMKDIFHSDSDYEEEEPESEPAEKDRNSVVTSERNPGPGNDGSDSMVSDSTSFIELVVGKKAAAPPLSEKGGNRSKPAMVLESDSDASSSDGS